MHQYINWNSNHPNNMLLGLLKGLVHRAHVLCSRKEDLLEKLALLKNVFGSNGYMEKLVLKTVPGLGRRRHLRLFRLELRRMLK